MDNGGVRRIDGWNLKLNCNACCFATGDAIEGTMNNRYELAGGERGVNSAPLRPGSGPGCGPNPNQCENRPEPVTVTEPAVDKFMALTSAIEQIGAADSGDAGIKG